MATLARYNRMNPLTVGVEKHGRKAEPARKKIGPAIVSWVNEIFYPVIKPQLENTYDELNQFLKEEYQDICDRLLRRRIERARRDLSEVLERIKKTSNQEEINALMLAEKYLRDNIYTLEIINSGLKTEMLILHRSIESKLKKSLNRYYI